MKTTTTTNWWIVYRRIISLCLWGGSLRGVEDMLWWKQKGYWTVAPSHVSSDAGDIQALTPNHFLLFCEQTRVMKRLMLVRERSTQQKYGDSPKRLSTSFGSALPRSITLALQIGRSEERRGRIKKEGDVVLVAEPNRPRVMTFE